MLRRVGNDGERRLRIGDNSRKTNALQWSLSLRLLLLGGHWQRNEHSAGGNDASLALVVRLRGAGRWQGDSTGATPNFI